MWCGCSYSALAERAAMRERTPQSSLLCLALAKFATSTSHNPQAVARVYTAFQPSTLATPVARYHRPLRTIRSILHEHHPSWRLPLTRCATTTIPKQEKLLLTPCALQIKQIEDEMAKTQKNKATSFHLGTHSHFAPTSKSKNIQD